MDSKYFSASSTDKVTRPLAIDAGRILSALSGCNCSCLKANSTRISDEDCKYLFKVLIFKSGIFESLRKYACLRSSESWISIKNSAISNGCSPFLINAASSEKFLRK